MQMGCLWRASKSRLLSTIRKSSKKQVLELKPSNIQSTTAWKNWVKKKTDEAFEVVYFPALILDLCGFVLLFTVGFSI